jgi:tetratricopeptide (TPR) repeat protein
MVARAERMAYTSKAAIEGHGLGQKSSAVITGTSPTLTIGNAQAGTQKESVMGMKYVSFLGKPTIHIALALVVGLGLGNEIAAQEHKPAATPSPKNAQAEPIDKLIKQLGDKNYYVRQRAQDEIAKRGFEAFDAINAATTSEDLEIAARAKYLLRLMRVEWTAESDSPEVKRCLRDYEFEDAEVREAKMKLLANLPNGQGVAPLCRLVRFEKLLPLSKAAAIALLNARREEDLPDAATIEIIRKTLGDSQRVGALWLLAWIRLDTEPDAVMTEWKQFVTKERNLLRRARFETSNDIVAGLTRFQIVRLKKLNKTKEMQEAIQQLVALDPGTPESMAELLDWLTEQKAWSAIEELANRFSGRFAQHPDLLYTLAQAYAEQGKKDQAEVTAAKAFHLYPRKQQGDLLRHLMAAQHLRVRGMFDWAKKEFEYIVSQDAAGVDEVRAMALNVLAEMLHDQGKDNEAAEILKKLVADIQSGKVTENELNGRRPSEVRSRMHYFSACHWDALHDAAKHREAIDEALKADPSDVDVLIACYRLPSQTPEYHAKILDWIRKSADQSREEIASDAESPSPYNQFAWLIGNTEGDFDEALKCSLKALELKPDEGGFYDTLARVYYAKGDLENAVKQQTKAAELEPHSGLIRRQLEFFRKKLEEKKKS